MTAHDMWQAFTALHPDAANVSYEAWSYGAMPDELAQLTLSGVKRATASAHAVYALEGEPIPQAGEYSVILDAQENAVCVIRTAQVRILPYRDMDERQAYLEGEGDRSLDYWREVHEQFFRQELAEYGLEFTEDIAVVCEEFEVMYP